MSDDNSLANIYASNPAIPADIMTARLMGYDPPTASLSPATQTFLNNWSNAVAAGKVNPYQPMGPGGKSPIGTALAWQPYDPTQQIFDTHQHFGATYDDPVLGKLQSVWTEPSKSANDFWNRQLGPTLFGAGLAAITAGAASPFLGPLFNAATKLGSGTFDPLSFAMSLVPGALGGIDPALAAAYKAGSTAYGLGRSASEGNYTPAANLAANATLGQIFNRG